MRLVLVLNMLSSLNKDIIIIIIIIIIIDVSVCPSIMSFFSFFLSLYTASRLRGHSRQVR